MNKPSTCFAYLLGVLGSLFLHSAVQAQASTTYVPAEVTGYTEDVIADGVGPVANSTTSTFDRGNAAVRWCLADTTYVNPAGQRPLFALSPTGIVRSRTTPGMYFKLGTPGNATPSVGRNSLRIDGAGTGVLTLRRPQSCSEVIILAAEGNGTNATDKVFTVRFTDGTLQVVPGIIVPDWYGGIISPAIYVRSRVNRGTTPADGVENNAQDPTLYEVHIPLSPINYTKLVQSITVVKTLTDPILNIMAVSLGATCLTAPAPGQTAATVQNICPGGSATLSVTGSAVGSSITYQWQSSIDGGLTYTDIVGATTRASITVRPTVTTSYRVRVACGIQVSFSNVTLVTILPNTATLAYGTPPEVPTFCQQQGPVPPLSFSPMNNASGRFTSSSPGLVINPTTGVLNVGASTTGTYTVTYTITSPCPATATATVNVIRAEATLVYAETSFCRTGSSGAPAFTPAGGTFSSTQGLSINASTGIIDLANSTVGTYRITYTSSGLCPASATATVNVIRTEASLAYAETTFCRTGSSGAPAFTPAGGTFTSTQGLAIDASTGVIDLANSTAGTYPITYTSSPGQCPASASASVLIKSDALPVFPNVIVPNSPNFHNNNLHLEFPSEVTSYHLTVYNRWGRKVWESSVPTEGWSAESKSGGTYYYRVDYNDCAGRPQTYKGWVDVIK